MPWIAAPLAPPLVLAARHRVRGVLRDKNKVVENNKGSAFSVCWSSRVACFRGWLTWVLFAPLSPAYRHVSLAWEGD